MKKLISVLKIVVPVVVVLVLMDWFFDGEFYWEKLVSKIFAGIVYGLFFVTMVPSVMSKMRDVLLAKVKFDIASDASILIEAPASHLVNMEAVGGKMILTDKKLMFKSHRLNIQNHEQDFMLSEIVSVKAGEKPQDFHVVLEDKAHKFLVEDPKRWMELIQSQK